MGSYAAVNLEIIVIFFFQFRANIEINSGAQLKRKNLEATLVRIKFSFLIRQNRYLNEALTDCNYHFCLSYAFEQGR